MLRHFIVAPSSPDVLHVPHDVYETRFGSQGRKTTPATTLVVSAKSYGRYYGLTVVLIFSFLVMKFTVILFVHIRISFFLEYHKSLTLSICCCKVINFVSFCSIRRYTSSDHIFLFYFTLILVNYLASHFYSTL